MPVAPTIPLGEPMTVRSPLGTRLAAGLRVVPGLRVVAATAAVVTVLAWGAHGLLPHPAAAATAYRYWAYYVASGDRWIYSQRGPAFEHPVDGEVQGWRFGMQGDVDTPLTPRAEPDPLRQRCLATPPPGGSIRVGIVIDFGTTADAPPGEHPPSLIEKCVTVRQGASGADVLVAAVGSDQVRIGSNGLICGIEGYPKTECAPAVTLTATPSPARTTGSAPTTTPAPAPSGSSSATSEPAATTPTVRPTPASSPSPPSTAAATTHATLALSPPPTPAAASPAASAGGGVPPGALAAFAAAVVLGGAGAATAVIRRRSLGRNLDR